VAAHCLTCFGTGLVQSMGYNGGGSTGEVILDCPDCPSPPRRPSPPLCMTCWNEGRLGTYMNDFGRNAGTHLWKCGLCGSMLVEVIAEPELIFPDVSGV
jgi:hypothetical protein